MMAGLNGSAQTVVPTWVRARALGIYLLVFQGGLGLGSALWGLVAEHVGSSTALASSAGGALLGLVAMRRWPLRAVTSGDLTPSAHWPEPHLDVMPAPDDGPVRVEVEYRIDPSQADAFTLAIRDLEPIRRRDGAVHWAVYQDPGEKGRYVESFVVESWVEHLRQHERMSVSDRAVQERIRQFHVAGTPPAVTHLIAAH
jgi:quinol monooxygenase YgiN